MEWKKTCTFRDILVERELCRGIALTLIPDWLCILDGHKAWVLDESGLKLEKRGNQMVISFEQAILEPKSIVLSSHDQIELKQILLTVASNFRAANQSKLPSEGKLSF